SRTVAAVRSTAMPRTLATLLAVPLLLIVLPSARRGPGHSADPAVGEDAAGDEDVDEEGPSRSAWF
ncbi:MAG: hypothetical protein ACRDUY_02875, partial [Nitriliruptorales bacterium]